MGVHRMIVCCAATVSMFAVVLCALVAVAAAQQPKPCNTPPQWQGKFERRADKFNFTKYAEISYDFTNKRVREMEFLVDGANKTAYDVLYLHNVNEEYRIDLKTKNCTKHPLSRPFIPFGMPDGARYVSRPTWAPSTSRTSTPPSSSSRASTRRRRPNTSTSPVASRTPPCSSPPPTAWPSPRLSDA